jgi:signal transduction histidine kinase
VLTERGVPAALQALAARSPVPVVVDTDLDVRLPAAHQAALYFVAAEALTNAAKYAEASAGDGSGLRGLVDRVEALGGRCQPPAHGEVRGQDARRSPNRWNARPCSHEPRSSPSSRRSRSLQPRAPTRSGCICSTASRWAW